MSWRSAKDHAARSWAAWKAANPGVALRGQTVKLTDFEDEEGLRFLKPEQDWSLDYHRMVNRAMARLIKRDGGHVEFVVIDLKSYFDYLAKNHYENTTAIRARYILEA